MSVEAIGSVTDRAKWLVTRMRQLADRIEDFRRVGQERGARVYEDLLEDLLADESPEVWKTAALLAVVMPEDDSVSVAVGPKGAFAAQQARPWGCTCKERMADCRCWDDFPGPVAS